MNRQKIFTPEELADLALALKTVRPIDEYSVFVGELFAEHFPLDGGFAVCYHFFDGHLHLDGFPEELREAYGKVLGEVSYYQPDVWYEMCHSGTPWGHAALYVEDFPDKAADVEKVLDALEGRGEIQLGTWAYEGRFLLATAGLFRPLKAGDFSEADIQSFRMLIPFWQEGIIESARFTRAQRLGGDFAHLIENHPSALFLFDERDRLFYANRAAKLILQREPRSGYGMPCIDFSPIQNILAERKSEATAVLPLGQTAQIYRLPDWPELNLRKPWLAVVPETPAELPLSERETEVLRAYAASNEAEAAAKSIGTSVATYRTHLANITRKLGVSGSNAALTMWYLNGR